MLVAVPGASQGNGASPSTVARSSRVPKERNVSFRNIKGKEHQVLNGLSPTDPETWIRSCLIP